jgi:hypothetical protein
MRFFEILYTWKYIPKKWSNCQMGSSNTLDIVAERLRRWTANPLGSPRVGSNPIDVVRDIIRKEPMPIEMFLPLGLYCLDTQHWSQIKGFLPIASLASLMGLARLRAAVSAPTSSKLSSKAFLSCHGVERCLGAAGASCARHVTTAEAPGREGSRVTVGHWHTGGGRALASHGAGPRARPGLGPEVSLSLSGLRVASQLAGQ